MRRNVLETLGTKLPEVNYEIRHVTVDSEGNIRARVTVQFKKTKKMWRDTHVVHRQHDSQS